MKIWCKSQIHYLVIFSFLRRLSNYKYKKIILLEKLPPFQNLIWPNNSIDCKVTGFKHFSTRFIPKHKKRFLRKSKNNIGGWIYQQTKKRLWWGKIPIAKPAWYYTAALVVNFLYKTTAIWRLRDCDFLIFLQFLKGIKPSSDWH